MYDKKLWENRVPEFPGRVTLESVKGEEATFDMRRADGEASVAGDTFDATTMNDMEQRIEDAFGFAEKHATGISEDLEDFKARRDNPHEVTAEQVGAYSTGQIEEILGNYSPGNFYTKEEIDALFEDYNASFHYLLVGAC